MADYHCWPLWWAGEHEPGNIDPKTLPLHNDIVLQLESWAAKYDAQLNQKDPSSSKFFSKKDLELFSQNGVVLWKKLSINLFSDYEVWFFHPALKIILRSPKELDTDTC